MMLLITVILVLVIRVSLVQASFLCAKTYLPPRAAMSCSASRWHQDTTTQWSHECERWHSLHRREPVVNQMVAESSSHDCESSQFLPTRRSILSSLAGSFFTASTCAARGALAMDDDSSTESTMTSTSSKSDRKPYAPLENLLPATRVKVLIDESFDTATALVQSTDKQDKDKLVVKLKSLLLDPHEFFKTRQELSTSKTYLEQETGRDWQRARREERKNMFQIQVDPATELNEAFEQWGERRQFKRLRRQQLALEQSNKMRAAFNAYTNNLVFGEKVTVTASPEEKKRLIRQYDQLPDVTSVVRSDLDLRDLYRNQVLTAMDDAKAELEYQLSCDEKDFSELVSILKDAQSSCSEWFKFVPENDMKQALDIVVHEQD